jgi:hypothetical protein
MKLVIKGRAGRRVCDWQSFALLRDNVQHFLESGEPSSRFQALHGIELAVDEGSYVVDAARLRGEVLRAWVALWKVRLDSAAISLRTRAILTGNSEPPECRGTLGARHAGWDLPLAGAAEQPVPQVARRFIRTVLALTDTAVDGDVLEVRCVKPDVARGRVTAPPVAADRRGWLLKAGLVRVLPLSALLLSACVSTAAPQPQLPEAQRTPPTNELTETRPQPPREIAPIIAPPPGYGNKVVTTRASQERGGVS